MPRRPPQRAVVPRPPAGGRDFVPGRSPDSPV